VTEQTRDFPEFYITAPQPCPYLPGRRERKVFTHISREKPAGVVDHLLRTGFRRSQNIAYTPYCDGCQACVSVRILVDEFQPRRTFQRTIERNRDIIMQGQPTFATEEQYDLFRNYIETRHGEGGMADMSVLDYALMIEDSIIESSVTEYRLREPTEPQRPGTLKGVALCDVLSDGISMVYSFYDPHDTSRSLGTYIILTQIEEARRRRLPYVYLGYWIRGSRKMSYKSRFVPQERLMQSGWTRA
jgi:leucyl-tRNA---protein transferase